jgi:putative membrane protein
MGNSKARLYTKLDATMAARELSEKPAKGAPVMTYSSIRSILLGTATALCPITLLAQNPMGPPTSGSQPDQSQQTRPMQDSSAGMGNSDSSQSMKDKMFVRKVAEGGMAEVQFGQLAAEKGSSQDVKDLGQKMVTDHTALNSDMAPIAQSMGVAVPKKLNKQHQADYDKLNGLSGEEFDKAYITAMVKDHHKDLREFQDEATSTTDPALKAAAEKGVKMISEHTMVVDKIAKDKGISMPGRTGKQEAPPPTL